MNAATRTVKTRFGTQVPVELIERVRRTVAGLQREQPELTLSQFVTDALTDYTRQMEKEHNGGEPFGPVRRLRRGPRIKGEDG